MSNIRIARMTEKEVPKVAAIEAEIFSCPWSEQSFLDTLCQDNVKFYLAMEGDEVLGYCGIYTALDEGEITNVAVKPEFRRRHIADEMLGALIEECLEEHICYIFLEARVSNEAAIRLYEKHGFAHMGVRKNFYEKPREDACVMCRQNGIN